MRGREVRLAESRRPGRVAARARFAVAPFLLVVTAACTDPPGNDPNLVHEPAVDASAALAACPRILPPKSSCGEVPSYATEILPIVQRSCLMGCHQAGGVAANQDLSTYRALSQDVTPVLTQVLGCIMPPAEAGANAGLSASDKMELLTWLVCGFPDN